MNRNAISKYVEEEVLKGKKHQEIFNHIVKNTDFNIHDVATIVRKTPVLEKRQRYQLLNYVLCSIIGLLILSNLLVVFGAYPSNFFNDSKLGIVSLILPGILFVGILKYKRNVHLIAGVLFLIVSFWTLVRFVFDNDFYLFISLFVTFFASILAFYLNSKLVGDYRIDRELQKQYPDQRENLLLFKD